MDLPVSPSRYYTDAEEQNGQAPELSPFSFLSTYNIGIFYMLWYAVVCHWNLANHVAWVRFNDTLLDGKPPPQLYLTFVVVGEVTYFIFGAILLFRSAKYAKTEKERWRYLSAGIVVMYLFTDVPMFLLDMTIVFFYGWIAVVQSTAWTLRTMSFMANTVVAWHIYLHRMTKFIHQRLWVGRMNARDIATRQQAALKLKELKRQNKLARQARQ